MSDEVVVAIAAEQLVEARAAVESVVPVSAQEAIVAALAAQRVMTGAAVEFIVVGATNEEVVTSVPKQLGWRERAIALIDSDVIVSGQTENEHNLRIGDRAVPAFDRDGAAVDQQGSARIAADDDRVVLAVAGDGQHAATEDGLDAGTLLSGRCWRNAGQQRGGYQPEDEFPYLSHRIVFNLSR
jgi:hypothetical protein